MFLVKLLSPISRGDTITLWLCELARLLCLCGKFRIDLFRDVPSSIGAVREGSAGQLPGTRTCEGR
jgi:hypothetical protein